MPPRYSYWTIIAGGLPTAFRAAEKEELQPTFTRIKHKHPDAEMKWFARGKLWDSPESARSANRRSEESSSRPSTAPRGRDWRPGGEHRDPRQKYRDAKTARNVEQRKRKFQRKREFDRPGETRADRRPPDTKFEKRSFPRSQRPTGPSRGPSRQTPVKMDRPDREPRRRDGDRPPPPPKPSQPKTFPSRPPERGRRDPRRNRR